MAQWVVDEKRHPGVLYLMLDGALSAEEMAAFVHAHDAAIERFAGADYRVFCDIRELRPLSPPCSALFERAKANSAAHSNFKGSAVLARSQLVALQHQRTSVSGGVMATELISDVEKDCWDHLARVNRG